MNEVQKLDIYKRIAGIETQEQRADMQDELADRFGEVPQTVDNLLRISLIRVQAHKLFMTEVKGRAGVLTFTMLPDGEINVDRIPEVLNRCRGSMKFSPKGKPVFTYRYYQTGIGKKDEEELLGLTEKLVSDIFSVLVTVKETAAG